MRKLLTTFMLLLVVLAAGMTALVLLVNPNDFQAYIIKQVEQKSGYQLALHGDLRWHAWPQLSILTGRITLTVPGAKTAVISAENMRLDVKLWPLLSHRLVVKQVMLKGAVIHFTADSQAQQQVNAPIAPTRKSHAVVDNKWKLAINNIQMVDSLLIWQRAYNDHLNVRDINLSLEQTQQNQVKLDLASRVSRDRQDLLFSVKADVDLQHYPHKITANVDQFTYQLEGADIPIGGIRGQGAMQASYQDTPRKVTLSPLTLSANENQLTGSVSAELTDLPHYVVNVAADKLDLDTIFTKPLKNRGDNGQKVHSVISAPVIAGQSDDDDRQHLKGLRDFTAQLVLTVNHLIYQGITISDLNLQANNQQGKVRVNTLAGKLLGGDFSVPSTLDVTNKNMLLELRPEANQITLGPILQALNLPQVVTGKFSMKGQLAGEGADFNTLNHSWQGNAHLTMENARLHGLNIQQLIQQTVTRNNRDLRGQDRYERYTEIQQLQANTVLHKGVLNVSDMNAHSAAITLKGNGSIDLPGQQCEMNLSVRVIQGWKGQDKLVEILQNTSIPLRIYGSWHHLQYQLDIDQLLHSEWRQRAKKALSEWAERNKQSQDDPAIIRDLLDKL